MCSLHLYLRQRVASHNGDPPQKSVPHTIEFSTPPLINMFLTQVIHLTVLTSKTGRRWIVKQRYSPKNMTLLPIPSSLALTARNKRCVCMCVYVCVYIYDFLIMFATKALKSETRGIHTHTHTNTHTHTCTHTHTHTHTHVHVSIHKIF